MTRDEILDGLTTVFREIFEDEEIVLSDAFSAHDYEAWDSLNHITLIMQTEKHFAVKFSHAELAGLNNVGDLIGLIEGKAS